MGNDEAASDKLFTVDFVRLLAWIGSSTAISTFFVFAGFLVEVSFDEKLGFRVGSNESNPSYARLSASFLLDSVRSLGDSMIVYKWWILGAGVALGILFRAPPVRYVLSILRRRSVIISLMTLAVLAKLCLVDIPAGSLRNLLSENVTAFSGADSLQFLGSRIRHFESLEVCSRLGDETEALNPAKAGYECEGAVGRRSATAISEVNQLAGFATVLALVVFGLVAVLAMGKEKDVSTRFGLPSTVIVTGLVLTTVVTMPLTYGRLQMTTMFDEVELRLASEAQGDPTFEIPHSGFLLANLSDRVLLYPSTGQAVGTGVISIPQSLIVTTTTIRRGDVLKKHLALTFSRIPAVAPRR